VNQLLERFQELEPSRKLALAIVAPLLLVAAYWFFLLSPRLERTASVRRHIDDMLQERDRKAQEVALLPERQKEVEDLDRQLKIAMARLPDEKEIDDLLSSVSDLARSAGLDILVFRQKPETYQDFYAEVPVEMQVRGRYHDVGAFLDRVGKMDRIVTVRDLGMKDPKVVDDEIVLQASSRVTTYRFLSDAERQALIQQKKIQPDGEGADKGKGGKPEKEK
jgi:type IV pilus assembly protein PilO